MQHTFVVYMEDKPGVLARVAILVRRCQFNVETITAGHTGQPGVTRMTIVVEADEHGAHRIESTLYKLVNVLLVENVTADCVSRDLALIKVSASAAQQPALREVVERYRAETIETGGNAVIIEATGSETKIDELVRALEPFGVLEMVRSGRIAMAKSTSAEIHLPGNPAHAVA